MFQIYKKNDKCNNFCEFIFYHPYRGIFNAGFLIIVNGKDP